MKRRVIFFNKVRAYKNINEVSSLHTKTLVADFQRCKFCASHCMSAVVLDYCGL